MKKIIALIIFIVIIITSYFAAGPYITIYKIKSGYKNNDVEKTSSQIDFPALRTNLKAQFKESIMKKTKAELNDNPFAALGVAFASKIVDSQIDSMVDEFVNLSFLESFMVVYKTQQKKDGQKVKKADSERPEPFENARYTYDDFNNFSAWMTDNEGKETRFIFTRKGLSWKLSNVQLPIDIFESKNPVSSKIPSTEEHPSSVEKTSEPSAFKVVLLEKKFTPADYQNRISDSINIYVAFTNMTGKDIRAFDGVIGFTDLLDNEIYSARVAINKRVAANTTLEWYGGMDCNPYIDSHRRLKNEDFENLKVYFKTRKILFDDGTTKDYLSD